jgi:hypothetical protein
MTTTRNPMGYTCAPNQATPDYVIYHDLRNFIAYGLQVCWLGTSNTDPNEDCNFSRPITHEDVTELRGYFLDTMETLITALWGKDYEPGQGDIDGDYQSLIIGKDTDSDDNSDFDEESLTWHVRLDKDSIMLDFDDGADGSAYWLSYSAITKRENVLKILTEARQYAPAYNNTVWDKLTELAQLPDEPITDDDDDDE